MDAVKFFDDKSLDFVYIDGNHEYSYVMEDLIFWFEKVKINGIMAGHDFGNREGVYSAVNAWCNINDIQYIEKLPDFYFKRD